MDIKQLQEFIAKKAAVSEPLQMRIMRNEMTVDDIRFMERTITTTKLIEIGLKTNSALQELNHVGMDLNKDKERNGYSIKLVDWMVEFIREINESCEDVGLTDIKPIG